MSRVRGSDSYRLVVTHPTSIDLICESLGLDRDQLLACNPYLETEELEAGQELIVPATESEGQAVAVVVQNADEASRAVHFASDRITKTVAESPVEAVQDVAADAPVEDVPTEIVATVAAEAPNEAPDSSEPEPAGEQVEEAQPVSEAPTTSEVEPAQSAAASQSITWRPFPKSDL